MGKLHALKRGAFFIAFLFLFILNLQAQAPNGFNYQGVALNNAGTPVSNKKISLRISLIESQQLGTIKFQELHNVNTDAYGQFSIIIGNGQAITGKIADVMWNKYPYYMKVELDLDGGSAFVFVGTSQLLSVPYALYANNAGAASISVDSVKSELATIKLIQRGDSVLLLNGRGSVYIPKIDSIAKIVSQIAGIKSGVIKYIRDSATKTPYGLAIGYDALKSMDTIVINPNNYAIGNGAGASLSKGKDIYNYNENILFGTATGAGLGASNTGGAMQNVMIGNYAGQNAHSNATGNVLLGWEAGRFSSGTIANKTVVFNQNVAIGRRALQYAKNADNNVSIGADNFNASADISRNVSIGANTANQYIGDDNVILGSEMLTDTSSNGSKNVIIGAAVATNLRGSGNIILGYKAASDSVFLNSSNKLIISSGKTKAPLVYGEFDNKKVTINGDLTVTGKFNGSTGANTNTSLADSKGNIAVGSSALITNKSGSYNIAIGESALSVIDSGSNNIAIGRNALKSSPKLGSLVAIGENALSNVTTGFANTGLGSSSLASTTTGDRNTGVGASSLISNTTGKYNVAIGVEALRDNTTGWRNTAVGMNSLLENKTASNNTAIGFYSQLKNITGGANTSLGDQSLTNNTSGSNNTSIGWGSLDQNKSGSNNTALGYNAGSVIDSGSNNVFIGSNAGNDNSFVKVNNKLIIANSSTKTPLVYGEFDNKNLTVNGDLTVTGKFNLFSGISSSISDSKGNISSGASSLSNNKTGYGNVALGNSALNALDSGSNNIAIGANTLTKMVIGGGGQGSENIAIGMNALMNSKGNGNMAIGVHALQSATTALWNTAIGGNNLRDLTTGSANTAIGGSSMIYSSGSASNNVTVGESSGQYLSSDNNTIIGAKALYSATTGSENISIGFTSLYNNKTSSKNIAIGNATLSSHINKQQSDGDRNIAIGYQSLFKDTSGIDNTSIGSYSLVDNLSGTSNVTLGNYTLQSNKVGSNNTAIGKGAGSLLQKGDSNIFIGNYAAANQSFINTSNKLVIQNDSSKTPLIFGEFDKKILNINGDLVITGKATLPKTDSTIAILKNRIDSLVAAIKANGLSGGTTSKSILDSLGSPFAGYLTNLFGGQIEEDLCYDSWMGYMNTPTNFVGNVNNTTYYIRWNSYWGRIYNNIMSPTSNTISIALRNDYSLFSDWAKLIRVIGISKLTAIHGPVIYSNYGSGATPIIYDRESDLYNILFAQLDTIQSHFKANVNYTGFRDYDRSFNGNITSWMKVVNSIRLRLAMRLSKVNPSLAKAQGEKAITDPVGLIRYNSENFMVSLNGNIMPVAQISWQWDDTRMGGPIEQFMVGYKDGRIDKFFEPISNSALAADHPSIPYKGIRNGSYINAKADRVPFSKVANDFNSVLYRRAFTASETHFLLAEASLRGWAGAGVAKTNYENGIRLSFEDWGVNSVIPWGLSNVSAYLTDATSKPIAYVDPINAINNNVAYSTMTIAWNESATNEYKLEKIMTQKYIASFTNTLEAWCDFRRTGYPKIPHVAKNDSNTDWGVITADQWIKRMPFTNGERTGNAAGVADAITKMGVGGKDDIATRLWFDTGFISNF